MVFFPFQHLSFNSTHICSFPFLRALTSFSWNGKLSPSLYYSKILRPFWHGNSSRHFSHVVVIYKVLNKINKLTLSWIELDRYHLPKWTRVGIECNSRLLQDSSAWKIRISDGPNFRRYFQTPLPRRPTLAKHILFRLTEHLPNQCP